MVDSPSGFVKRDGVSFSARVNELRLQEAFALLSPPCDGARRISDLALQVGVSRSDTCSHAAFDKGLPEVTAIRIRRDPSVCTAPRFIAEELRHNEEFGEAVYVPAHVTDALHI